MDDIEAGVGGRGTRTVIGPAKDPDMGDYDLTDARLESAKNGVIVTCEHCLKPEVEKKMKGKDGKTYVDYDVRRRSTKHVFNDRDEATAFLSSNLMGKAAKAPAPEVTEKTKVKVTKR